MLLEISNEISGLENFQQAENFRAFEPYGLKCGKILLTQNFYARNFLKEIPGIVRCEGLMGLAENRINAIFLVARRQARIVCCRAISWEKFS